jgi:hypothetical protein
LDTVNYKIITNLSALEAFIAWLPEPKENEKFYLCLFARKKYCDTVGWIKSDKTQMKRFLADKDRMLEKIMQLECPVGAYRQKGNIIPQESLALYVSPNPRDLWKANFDAIGDLGQVIRCNGRTSNPHQEVMSSIQRARGTKHFVDFDIDEKSPEVLSKVVAAVGEAKLNEGYHILVRPKLMGGDNGSWHRGLSALADVRGDTLIPVPGTFQGGFTPRFLTEDDLKF